MSRKLREKPNNIEELTEKREWMKQIPEQLKSYKVQIEGISYLCYLSYKSKAALSINIFLHTGTY